MNCPNCGSKMSKNCCIRCGYMTNGNFVKVEKNKKIILRENYLQDNYSIVINNKKPIAQFLLGGLYLSLRSCFLSGFIFGITDLIFVYFATQIIHTPITNQSILYITIIINRLFWIVFGNNIYLKILDYKLKKNNNYNKKYTNIIYPVLTILIYIVIIYIITYLHK